MKRFNAISIYSLFCAILLLALPAQARDEVHVYEVYASGIKVGNMNVSARLQGNRYAVVGTVKGTGIVGALFDVSFSGRGDGKITGSTTYQPEKYTSSWVDDGDKKSIVMRYRGTTPAQVQYAPPRKPRSYDIVASAQTNTLDPVTAALSLLGQAPSDKACNRTVEIFDGAKRSRIKLGAQKPGPRGSIICSGVYTRLAGFRPSQIAKKQNFPFTMFYRKEGDQFIVTRFETDSVVGRVAAVRR